MEFLSEKFALKSPPSKNSDFYMGAGGALEHVMETLDNESFYSKASAGKCVQAFGPLPRAEHHVRLERTSPCQDSSGESPYSRGVAEAHPQIRGRGPVGTGREGRTEGRKENRTERRKERKGERESWRAEEGSGTVLVLGSGVWAAADFSGGRGGEAKEGARPPGVHPRGSIFAAESRSSRALESRYPGPGRKLIGR